METSVKSSLSAAASACIILLNSFNCHAAPISGQGGWETTLQARDLDGDPSNIEAFYDTNLNITWLADAAFSVTESFGVTGTFYLGRLPSWDDANDWIDEMNAGDGYLGQNSWRLPVILGESDLIKILGFNNDPSRSELSHLFYLTLGNVANIDENGNSNRNPGLTNTAQFINLQRYYYWTGTESSSSNAWTFAMHSGDQYRRSKAARGYPLPVLDGYVGKAVNDGDITNDGTVDIADLIRAMQILRDVAPLINGAPSHDRLNTMADYLILTRKVLGRSL